MYLRHCPKLKQPRRTSCALSAPWLNCLWRTSSRYLPRDSLSSFNSEFGLQFNEEVAGLPSGATYPFSQVAPIAVGVYGIEKGPIWSAEMRPIP